MSNLLELLASRGFNLDFFQFLIKFDPGAFNKLIGDILNEDNSNEVLSNQSSDQDTTQNLFSYKDQGSYIASLDPTAMGNSLSSGFGNPVFIPLNNNYSINPNSGGSTFTLSPENLESDRQAPYIQQVMFYVPTVSVTIPITPPTPEISGTLAAWVDINQINNLFENETARNTTLSTNYHVDGQTIHYSITQTTVSLAALGQWGEINNILFTGDAYDLANKELSFANFKSVDVEMLDSPRYTNLPKAGLTLVIDGAKEGHIEATSVADTLTINHSTDHSPGTFVINTLDGDDRIYIQPSSVTYTVGGVPNDNSGQDIVNQIDVGKGNDLVDASSSLSQNQIVLGDGDDTAYTGGGNDTVEGNAGNDFIYGGDGEDQLQGNEGNDTLYGESGNDILYGDDGEDNLYGNDGDDEIYGGNGNDIIEGGSGNNVLNGGDGDDTFRVNAGENGVSTIQGDAGYNQIILTQDATLNLTQTFNALNSIQQITGTTSGINTIQGQNGVHYNWDFSAITLTDIDLIQSANGNDTIVGSLGNDTINGGSGDDTLSGNDGDDTIYGEAGNDTIAGGNGINIMYGGTGVNTYLVNAGETGLNTFYGGTGTGSTNSDTITFAVDATLYLSANFSSANSIERITGAASGINTIQGQSDLANNWNFSNLTPLTMTNIDFIKGGDRDDIITGSQGNDVIEGNAGNDTLYGGLGNDTLSGNDGDDTIYGEAGNDAIAGGNGINIMYGGTGVNTYLVNAGETGLNTFYGGTGTGSTNSDTITFAVDATLYLSANFSSANSIERITGAASGINTIQGQGDLINDWNFSTYTSSTMSNIDFIKGGDRNDIIRGSSGIDVIEGNSGDDTLYGNAGNDTLRGNDGGDTIFGGDGNDIIEGGQGNNTLDGGTGNDIFRVYSTDTGINSYQGGTGTDQIVAATDATVYLGQTFNAANSIERINGTANPSTNIIQAQDNIDNDWNFSSTTFTNIDAIQMGNGSDTVSGSSGNDTIYGNSGNDTISGNNGNDILNGNAGEDTIYGGIGNDTIHGDEDNDQLFGGEGNDVIYGDDGDDIIEGGNGTNTLYGGEGNDTFRINPGETGVTTFQGGTGTDQIIALSNANIYLNALFNAASSIEQITGGTGTNIIQGQNSINKTWDFSTTTMTNIASINTGSGTNSVTGTTSEDLIYGGTGNDTLRGNDGDDRLYGGNGNDTIYGDNGDDLIEGGNGTNTLYGGEGNDTFRIHTGETGLNTFQGGNGTDQIIATPYATIFLNTTFNATNSIEQINGNSGNIIQGRDGVNENWNFLTTTLNNIDSIQTGTGNDIVRGSTDNDTIDGGAGNDQLFGEAGNDSINGGLGNDTCNGGDGIDLAILAYGYSSYTFSYNPGTQVETIRNNVSGLETDTYVNFEFFNFNGVLYSFSAGTFTPVAPPIAMDLNGDGVHYSALPVLFDADSDGFLDLTQWVDSQDGLLTYDKDHDGKLSDISEISFEQYQEGARTDLEGLRAFDTNHNNQLDLNDTQWDSFGVTQNNQFLTLGQLNIVSIDLQSDNNFQLINSGTIEFGQGNFTYSDGGTGKFADVAFAYQHLHEEMVLSNNNNSLDTVLDTLGPKAATSASGNPTTPEDQITALPPTTQELDPIVVIEVA